ncbi:hypothetical protein MPSEU_000603100 [Mayamaea pseudoterrestris]|nr:hypothetical protein MPSEU_000603100 [Mayamaea pseudoterrestris]
MLRSQRFVQKVPGNSWRKAGHLHCRMSPSLSRFSTRPLPLDSVRVSDLPAAYFNINDNLSVRIPGSVEHERFDRSQKREAAMYLTSSLLRSQEFFPSTQILPAISAPVLFSQAQELPIKSFEVDDMAIGPDLPKWLRYFSNQSRENADGSFEWKAPVDAAVLFEQTTMVDESHNQSGVVDTDAQETSTLQETRHLDRRERAKNISFFNRPTRPHSDLYAAIKEGDHDKAMQLYYKTIRSGEEVNDTQLLYALFALLTTNQQPFAADKILLHYQTLIPGGVNNVVLASMYGRLSDCMRHMDPLKHNYHEIHKLTRSMVQRVLRLDRDAQQNCVPTLVSALAQQRATRVGHFANRLYRHMLDEGMTLKVGYWEHLLSMSKFNRSDDLPYADILQRVVTVGARCNSTTVLHSLENMYPFMDTNQACVSMRAIADLQRQESDDGQEYIIDLATLEALSSSAAQASNLDMTMLVWELVDVYKYEPSLALYENAVVTFASHQETYANAFIAMNDMKGRGMSVSRALIRGVSARLRGILENVDLALGQLQTSYQDGSPVSTEQLNCVMSAMAERGDVHCVSFVIDEFKRFGLEMDADSYSFALEGLGKHLYRVRKVGEPSEDVLRDCLEKASEYLSAMEDAEIVPTAHIIREYVELLCQADEVDTANEVVLEALESGGLVNHKTVYRVAMAQADLGNFVAARSLASTLSETLPELMDKVDRKEFETRPLCSDEQF